MLNEEFLPPPIISYEERKLLQFIKDLRYGEFLLKVRHGKPILIEEGIKSIKLEM